ncbi:MAG: hypothetical protein CMN20_13265 [Roseovarius sp.]|nr:hypothetical protein [Roseovarius sp.]
MRAVSTKHIAVIALACLASPAVAGPPGIFAYESRANFCPAGLQPVTLDGVICCGTPNQAQSYQQAMRHPVTHRVHVGPQARARDTTIARRGPRAASERKTGACA